MHNCHEIDATRITHKLYQGSYPIQPIRPCGFHVLVLCAKELQQRADEGGLTTVCCPLNDDGSPMTQREWLRAVRMAEYVGTLLLRHARVLVTCAQGRNRSGLVNALVLYRLTSLSGPECIEHIRKLRPGSLTNDDFVDALRTLPPKVGGQLSNVPRRPLHRVGPPHEFIG
jgi:protein-tyrosine phosphatase